MKLLFLLLSFLIIEHAALVPYSISDEILQGSKAVLIKPIAPKEPLKPIVPIKLIRPIAPQEPLKPIGNYSSEDEEQYKKAVVQYEKSRALFSKMKKQQEELERSYSGSNTQINQSEK